MKKALFRGLSAFISSRTFKVLVACLVIGLLVYYNRINVELLAAVAQNWQWLVLAFLFTLPPFFIVSYRFQLVLSSLGMNVPFSKALSWTMIGSFFDLAMPSSNGGDLVKAGYLVKEAKKGMRSRALMAVAFDRVLGVIGLFFLAFCVSLIGWSSLDGLPSHYYVTLSAFILGVVPLIVFRILGSRRLYRRLLASELLNSRNLGRYFLQLLGSFNAIRENPVILLSALALSMLNHAFWCVSLLYISYAVGNEVSPMVGFTVFPLAIFGGVFGVAGGFGVGTAAFDLVYSKLLLVDNGAIVGLIFQIMGAISRLFGLPFYLAASKLQENTEENRS